MKLRPLEIRDVSVYLLDDNPVYPIQRLEPIPDQPGDGGTPVGSLKELEECIEETGFIKPLMVAQRGDRYVILDGHRRLRVVRALGFHTVQCLVLTLEPGESVEKLWIQMQSQIEEEREWPWSEVKE